MQKEIFGLVTIELCSSKTPRNTPRGVVYKYGNPTRTRVSGEAHWPPTGYNKKGTHAGAFFMSRINVGYFALKYP